MKARKIFTYLLSFVLVSLFAFSVQAAETIKIGLHRTDVRHNGGFGA